MEEVQGLVQTIVILAACVVYLAKQGFDTYRRKSSGMDDQHKTGDANLCHKCEKCAGQVDDLHAWHKPHPDRETQQPRFPWYDNSREMMKELRKLRECVQAMNESITKLSDTIVATKG